ncbi:Glu-tRNA(Gln) amidotransferase GatDE subunit D, partial [Candidatus Woesearchaeota archaeon]
VSILSFGGTIASKVDYRTGGVSASYDASDFVEMCPELTTIANIESRAVDCMMSEDMHPDDWLRLAHAICEEANKDHITGIVVTHGTDTLHFSTAAMSFLLEDLNKPVIFTASQRSIDRGSTDAFMNLICAVRAAATWDGAEVVTCMHATTSDDYCFLLRGTKVRKMHTSRRDAFRPINEQPLAKVTDQTLEVLHPNYRKRTTSTVHCSGQFETNIALITIYPGIDPGLVEYVINKGVKGIVLAATALGHVPTSGKHSLVDVLEKAKEKGIPVVIASQTLYGRTNPYVYTNLRKLSIGLGCIFASDMTPETAYVKLGCILPKATSKEDVKTLLLENMAGEINEIIDERSFLN